MAASRNLVKNEVAGTVWAGSLPARFLTIGKLDLLPPLHLRDMVRELGVGDLGLSGR